MGIDHIDLWQLHSLADPIDWDVALSPGGAIEAAVEAKQQGLIGAIGVTGHGLQIAATHRRSLQRFDFDSVLLPYNYITAQSPYYAENFDALLAKDPRLFLFGEDVGKLGDVNQGVAGLQAKYGELRVADTGIREATIIGQAIGLALRGLRPIAEIQYLDYILYGLTALSDDLATLHWRTGGGQAAPVIIRTRGHRLEGIWHSGSPIGAL